MRLMMCVILVSSIAFGARGQESPRVRPPERPEIQAVLQRFVDQGEISGAVTLVAREGKIVHLGAVGQADLANQRPMQRRSLFAIASMTKPIIATALMILQDEGKVHLDDPVSKYIPEFEQMRLRSGESLQRAITLRDVLTHTSGLGGSQVFEIPLADAVLEHAQRPLDFQPGTKWQYSPGLNVVGRVIEIVSQQPLADFLQARLFTPLQMRNTTFFPNAEQQSRLAMLYQPGSKPHTLELDRNTICDPATIKHPIPLGELYSTTRDMYRFYQMVLDGGSAHGVQIVSKSSVQLMTTPQTGDLVTGFTPGNAWGLGWCIVRQPQGVTSTLSPGTFGHGGAFGTQGWVDPQMRTIYVLMIQRTKLPNSDDSNIRREFHLAATAALASQ